MNATLLLIVICVLAGSSLGQVISSRTVERTFYFSGYQAILYKIQLEENWWEYEWEVRLCDKNLLTSFRWYPAPEFHNFNYDPNGVRKPRYVEDINGDRKGELILSVISGGNNGWESSYIYTLDTIATEIAVFNGLNSGLNGIHLLEIDQDTIPELVFNDMNYGCWPEGCFGAPAPLLIWKWDGNKYRLSNLKYKEYLLNKKGWKDIGDLKSSIDSWVETFYKKPGYAAFPPLIAHVMIEFIYAGQYSKADSAFSSLWPGIVDGKERVHEEIWDRVRGSPFWQELQESDW